MERPVTRAALGLALFASHAVGQSVTPLPGATPTDLSRDGVAATGWYQGAPFVWTEANGFTALSGSVYNPDAVADLGAVVAGMVDDPITGQQSPGFWNATAGWTATGPLPGFGGCPGFGEVLDITADGAILGGELFIGCTLNPFRWTAAGGYEVLPKTGSAGSVEGLSGDGQRAGGWDTHPTFGFRRAALWDAAGVESFPLVSPSNLDGAGEVTALNGDGSIYAGMDDSGPGAFVYKGGAFVVLGVPNNFPRPWAISDDGRVAVGSYGNIGIGFSPWVWTECGGVKLGNTFFEEQGLSFPAGVALEKVVGVSRDGATFLASYSGPGGSGAVYIQLGAPPCPAGVVYCTAGTSASGCQASISASGTPSANAPSGFTLDTSGVEGQKDGLYFFGVNGRQANPWGNGTSFQCVVPPVSRAGLLTGNGMVGACDGAFSQDLNAHWQAKPSKNPGAGALVQAQLWYRDPQNTSNRTTSLSDAVEFPVGP